MTYEETVHHAGHDFYVKFAYQPPGFSSKLKKVEEGYIILESVALSKDGDDIRNILTDDTVDSVYEKTSDQFKEGQRCQD